MCEACICTIGDEILIGQIVDTNSSFIARELNKLGIRVKSKISVGDDSEIILNTLINVTESHDIVVVTGGLGPTNDDITKRTLAILTKCERYVYNQEQLDVITNILKNRGVELTENNKNQALVPSNCSVIVNKLGTAPGMIFKTGQNNRCILFSLPGVPYEMEEMMQSVGEYIKRNVVKEIVHHRTLVTYGMPESLLSASLEEWEKSLPATIKLAYLPNPEIGIRLRLSSYNGIDSSSVALTDKYFYDLKKKLGNLVYGEDDDTLESVLYNIISKRDLTLSIAESCTGGKIASRMTTVPGSSKIFNGAVVTYSNESKKEILGVDEGTIIKYGAVSRECALEMALGARNLFRTNIALATTGIAGPDGGSIDKPVGTLWIAVSFNNLIYTKKINLSGDRQRNILRFSSESVNFLRLILCGLINEDK